MKPLYAHRLLAALLLSLFTTGLYAENASSHRAQVDTLFTLTQMEKKISQSVGSVVQLQLRQNPALSVHKETVTQFFEKYIGWRALEEDMVNMYMKTFSEDELKTINAFYITPAGQKVIKVVPQLVQQRNQVAMGRLQKNIGELQKLLADKTTPQ